MGEIADYIVEQIMMEEYSHQKAIIDSIQGISDHEPILQVTRLKATLQDLYEEEKEKVDSIIEFGIKRGFLTEKQRFVLGAFLYINT